MSLVDDLKNAHLIRDLVEGRVRYYWEYASGVRVSPELVSYEEAYEWWRKEVHDMYEGIEKRSSFIDRRSNDVKRASETRQGQVKVQSYGGRRKTDTPPVIYEDRAEHRLEELKRMLIDEAGGSAS